MNQLITKYSSACFDYLIAEDGFTKIVMKKDAEVTMEAVIELKEALAGYWRIANRKSRLLADIRNIKSVNRAVRKHISTPNNEVHDNTAAIAVLVDSLVSKMIASFFLGLNKPMFPLRIFNSEEKAKEWLETFNEFAESTEILQEA